MTTARKKYSVIVYRAWLRRDRTDECRVARDRVRSWWRDPRWSFTVSSYALWSSGTKWADWRFTQPSDCVCIVG